MLLICTFESGDRLQKNVLQVLKLETVGRSFETRGRDIARSKTEGFLFRFRLDFDHCAKVQRGIYVLRGRSMKMFPVLWNEFWIVIKYRRRSVYRILVALYLKLNERVFYFLRYRF